MRRMPLVVIVRVVIVLWSAEGILRGAEPVDYGREIKPGPKRAAGRPNPG